jgi:hypothetical protein
LWRGALVNERKPELIIQRVEEGLRRRPFTGFRRKVDIMASAVARRIGRLSDKRAMRLTRTLFLSDRPTPRRDFADVSD